MPDDRTIVIERFRDELGDWRVCILSPAGRARAHTLGPRDRGAAAGAARSRRTGAVVRRRHRDPAARGGRHDPGGRSRVHARGDRGGGRRDAPRHGAVREHLPGGLGACAAAAAADARSADGVVAAAPAQRRPARRRRPLPRVPDAAGGDAGVPPRSFRRAGAARADGLGGRPPHPVDRRRHRTRLAVRTVAAVRMDRGIHVRGRRTAGGAACGRALVGSRSAPRSARLGGPARAARPGGARRRRARAAASRGRAPRALDRRGPRSGARSRTVERDRDRGPEPRRTPPTRSTAWWRSTERSASGSREPTGWRRSRTPRGSATRSALRCRTMSPPPSPARPTNRSTI